MDCKRSLESANGDLEAATALLMRRGEQPFNRAARPATEGAIVISRHENSVVMIELRCETDFGVRSIEFREAAQEVSKLALEAPDGDVPLTAAMASILNDLRVVLKENAGFSRGIKLSGTVGSYQHHNGRLGALVKVEGSVSDDLLSGICRHLTAVKPRPLAVDESGLPAVAITRRRLQALSEARLAGNPPATAEKIASRVVKEWIAEHTLLGQDYLFGDGTGQKVRHYLTGDARIVRFARYSLNEHAPIRT